MKKKNPRFFLLLLLTLFLILPEFAKSQGFNIYNIDASKFPSVNGIIFARDQALKDYENLVPDDFDLFENGKNLDATLKIDCFKADFFPPVAIAMVFDVSSSMGWDVGNGEKRIDWIRTGAYAFLDSIRIDPPSSMCFLKFGGDVYGNSGFYTTKTPLYTWVQQQLTVAGGTTDFFVPFVREKDPKGAIPSLMTQSKDLRRVIIFLSDGEPERTFTQQQVDSIIRWANREKISVYSIFLLAGLNMDIEFICRSTGGKSYSVFTKDNLIRAYRQIVGDIQSRNICQLSWIAPYGCDESSRQRNVKLVFKRIPDSVNVSYIAPPESITNLDISPMQLLFGRKGVGTTQRQITLDSKHSDFTITGYKFIPDNGDYTVNFNGKTIPFTLKKGEKHDITIDYIKAPPDVSTETIFSLEGDPCKPPDVSLVAPCGGDYPAELNFGTIPIMTTSDKNDKCMFKNTTAVPISGQVKVEGVNENEFEIIKGGGNFNLAPGACLEVTVRFKPVSAGNKTAFLSYYVPNVCGTHSTKLTGNAVQNDFPLPVLDWRNRRINTVNDSTYVIENNGTIPVKITSIKLQDGSNNIFRATFPSVPLTINPGANISIPVSFQPDKEGPLTNYIDVQIEGSTNTFSGTLTGIGSVPKLSAPDVVFNATKVQASSNKNLTITNISTTMDLFITDIIMPNNPDFKFDVGAVTKNITVSKNNGTFDVPMVFNPQSSGNKTIKLIIKHDGGPGPVANYIDTVDISGLALGLSVSPVPLNFGTVLTCETRELPLTIDNDAPTEMTINDITISGVDRTNFSIKQPSISTVPANSKGNIIIIFSPDINRTYNAILSLKTSSGDQDIPMTGIGKVLPLISKFINVSQNDTVPGNPIDFKIKIDIPDYNKAVSKISVFLNYNLRTFSLNKSKQIKSDIPNWNWAAVEVKPGELRFDGTGTAKTSPFSANLEFTLDSYLTDVISTNVIAYTITHDGGDICLIPERDTLVQEFRTCFTSGRSIQLSNSSSILGVNPNPVSGDNLNLSVYFGSRESNNFEILDVLGKVVKVYDYHPNSLGFQEISLDLKEINSGTYHIRLKTPYSIDSKSFVLIK
ncbi:MAG: choice-of-anchor D domain-containing protein [Candidatus Kapabacteria bacterium]|nr:choice-of-anchor D domain-containing protein [Candidatus Kapabacteria bacterium]